MSITNGEINLFEPRYQMNAWAKYGVTTTFLQRLALAGTETSPNDKIEMDTYKGGQPIAPFVMKNVPAITVARDGFEAKEYEPPRISLEREITKKMLETRSLGETTHTTRTAEDRQRALIERDMIDMNNMIIRREEKMAGDLLANGQIVARGYQDDDLTVYRDETLSYGFTQKTVNAGTDVWTDALSTKLADIQTDCETLRQAGYDPKAMLIGDDAWNELKLDTDFLALLDNRRVEAGEIRYNRVEMSGNGYVYCGRLNEQNLDIWKYSAWYKDEAGSTQKYYPDDHYTIIGEPIGIMAYGAITQLENDGRFHTYEATRKSKILLDVNGDRMAQRLQSKPIPVVWDADAWVTRDCL